MEIDFTEIQIKKFVEEIRPKEIEIRKQLDFGYSWKKNTAILYSIRPFWRNPNELIQSEFAKIRYTKTTNSWTLYWMRASGKWELYEPFPTANSIDVLLKIIKEDAHFCFFG
ncbi:MAG TPA: DUF3024 domain-containing protein [Moheibacter sp.]|nr:DUF3024 domain-containing protein [Moheibacter sp.]